MNALMQIAEIAAQVTLASRRSVLVTRRDDVDSADEYAVQIDVDSSLGIEREGGDDFLIRFGSGRQQRRASRLGWGSGPLPHTQVRPAIRRVDGQRRHRTEV